MSFNLTQELGNHLPDPDPAHSSARRRLMVSTGGNTVRSSATLIDRRPVLQLNALPMTLAPRAYENAQSSINPNGSLTSLRAFSQLVDSIPGFTEYYSESASTISSVYKHLLHGASIKPDSSYAEGVIADARYNFDSAHLAEMNGTPGAWYPAYPTPIDWYDISAPSRFSEITLDLTGDHGDGGGPYRVLKSAQSDIGSGSIQKADGSSVAIDPATSLKSVKFRYLEVRLDRPWLNFQVFNLDGWFIPGQEAGFFSSGTTDKNQGIIPLITTSMLVAIDVEVAADWSANDRKVLDDAKQGGEQVSVGPFVIKLAGNLPAELHVIGWVSQLVPLAPRMVSGEPAGGNPVQDRSGADAQPTPVADAAQGVMVN
jgi:uncharacterized protein YaiE (UPF0345 family)